MGQKIAKKFIFPFRDFKKILPEIDQLLDKSGPLIEVTGFPMKIFVSKDIEFAAQVYGHPKIGTIKQPGILPRVQKVMRNKGSFILEGGEQWKKQRATTQKSFCPTNFDALFPHLLACTKKYIDLWKQSGKENSIDIFSDLRMLFCDLNFRIIFSQELDEKNLKEVADATLFLDLEFIRPIPLWVPTPSNLKFLRAKKVLDKAVDEAIILRRKKGIRDEDKDILGHLIKQNYEHDRLVGELLSTYFGASIMSTTMAWATYLIGSNKDVESRLAEEANELDLNQLSFQYIAKSFPYVQAVFKEVIRLYPSSWSLHRLTKDNIDVMGYKIPKKSLLIPLHYLTQRDKKLWESPEAFKPERFLKPQPAPNKYAYMPFGAGPRTCLGQGMASIIVPTLLLLISKNLRYEFAPRFKGDPIPEFGFEIHPKDEVHIRFS